MTLTHLTRKEGESRIHISHLFQYVSAWEMSKEMFSNLVGDLEQALRIAKETKQTQIVDQDGECSFHVTAAGYIILMLPWKTYKVWEDENGD